MIKLLDNLFLMIRLRHVNLHLIHLNYLLVYLADMDMVMMY